jgi:hypothetical protein
MITNDWEDDWQAPGEQTTHPDEEEERDNE